ncbi:MAG: CocE/NonD family hydrolase, partial [Gammaproteobacteria bacterium]|nr:CocE/NonD family hydrolase [Gammaproteobacteria bacterium]
MTVEIVDTFPLTIIEIEFERIPLSDGVHLACRYWLPEDATRNPVPAILEYIPYCTRDGTAARDEAMHPYFAGHGYAAVRVDIRGSGESEGVLLDEYLELEQDDALEVIAWIAKQPWCDGNVGMMGKSWGGFNGLQLAARHPPALKCIISVFSTDDRYADDVHYVGGCLTTQNPEWAFVMFPAMARPPDPALVGECWRDMWQQRLDAMEPWLIPWLEHQHRDAYWKHGSVCENFSDIDVPVYAIGGWADPYSNAIPRLIAGLEAPCKGLIGPWGHQYMHQAVPGPKMGFMDEALLWWDHWLKGEDTGLMDEPGYRVWVQ